MVHAGRRTRRLRDGDARRHGRAADPRARLRDHHDRAAAGDAGARQQLRVAHERFQRRQRAAAVLVVGLPEHALLLPVPRAADADHRLRGLGAADEVRHRPAGHPRGRGQGGRDRREHHAVQGARLRGQRGADRGGRRRLRVLPVVPQPDRRLRPADQRHDRALGPARRPRHAVGPGARRLRRDDRHRGGQRLRRRHRQPAAGAGPGPRARGALPAARRAAHGGRADGEAARGPAEGRVHRPGGRRDGPDADRRVAAVGPGRRARGAPRCWRSRAHGRASAVCGPWTASTSPSRPAASRP